MSLEYLIACVIVAIIPGPGVIYTISVGLTHGAKASLIATLGCTLGIIPSALASAIGLAALFHTSAITLMILKCAGAAYLLYMAVTMLRDTTVVTFSKPQAPKIYKKIITHGILLNVLNPKLSIFFLAFLPQFMRSTPDQAMYETAHLAIIFMIVTLIIFSVYGLFASISRIWLQNSALITWIRRGFSGVFMYLSAKLVFSD